MTWPPLRPAVIEFDADGVPQAPAFGDRYHPRQGAAAQARHVFLAGNDLPRRWQGQPDFTVFETGFGLGNNFLATWQAWRDDPARSERLHYVAVEAHPLTGADLARCHVESPWPELAAALQAAWPPLVAGLHPIQLDGGALQLLLAFGDIDAMARQLDVAVDAFFLDGFAPDRNPAMWSAPLLQALARKARAGATAATWSVARAVGDGLRRAGFEVERAPGSGGKREITRARYAPRFLPRGAGRRAAAASTPNALIVGAGLAGGWAAHALAQQGWRATVLDGHAEPAQETSGNPAGLFHATVNADDGLHARFNRAAALLTARWLTPWCASGAVAGAVDGLLRLTADDAAAMQALLDRQGLPPAVVQAVDAAAASRLAGVALTRAAWYFPGGGWVSPRALVRHLLATPGVTFRGGQAVDALHRTGDEWRLLDRAGHVIDRAAVVVLASGTATSRLWPDAGWPLGLSRGQVSWWSPAPAGAPAPRIPLAGAGYALATPDGGLLCGATAAPGDLHAGLRDADHAFNLDRLHQLTGWRAPDQCLPAGRVGWRVQTPARLPLVGPVPAREVALGAPTRRPARELPREPGLFVLGALGSRGLTWGPLAGQVLAAWISGAPMPLEARLRDALDPARWALRAAPRRQVGGA